MKLILDNIVSTKLGKSVVSSIIKVALYAQARYRKLNNFRIQGQEIDFAESQCHKMVSS